MFLNYHILVLCLCIIGVSLAVRDDGERSRRRNPDNWQSSNTMSREKGEYHIKPSDTIDIDDNPMMYDEGSADSEQDDDNDWGSGMGDDDEDSEGSGVPEPDIRPIERDPSNTGNKEDQKPAKENQDKEIPNKIDNMGPSDPNIEPVSTGPNHVEHTGNEAAVKTTPTIFGHPGILAAIIGGAVVGLLCAVLFVMFIVYRMRKKDEGSYALDEPKRSPSHSYTRAPTKEFYA